MAYNNYVRAFMGENLESMPDYQTAVGVFNVRKPYIKGKYKGERPLGRNRRHDRSRIAVDDNGSVVVNHYATAIITYHPDGSLSLNTGGWSSISTAQIMQELLGVDRVCRVNCKVYYRHNDEFHHVANSLRIEPNGSPLFVNNEYVWVLRKDQMKHYRKRYDFFLEYAKQVLTMSSDFSTGLKDGKWHEPAFEGETLKGWYMTPLINFSHRHDPKARDRARNALFDYLDSLSTKAEDERLQAMYELLTPVTYMMGRDFYRKLDGVEWSCDPTQFKRAFDTLLKHQFAEDLFVRKLAPKTAPVRDPNARFVE